MKKGMRRKAETLLGSLAISARNQHGAESAAGPPIAFAARHDPMTDEAIARLASLRAARPARTTEADVWVARRVGTLTAACAERLWYGSLQSGGCSKVLTFY